MLSKGEAKAEIRKLIEFYSSKRQEFDKLNEADVRRKLIDRVFGFLGWDVYGKEFPDEVQREESISGRESRKKKADYVFRLYNVPKFVVEAKALKVDAENDEFREQVIGYSYNLACSWGVLTNFRSLIIFFVDRDDNTKIRHISDISDTEKFEQNFDALWMLSKEGVKDKLLEKDIEMRGIKQAKAKVDKRLFEDLKLWRKSLSDEIKRKYGDKYKPYEIEETVQRIIDRLIFIRKLEDMELEPRKLEQIIRKHNGGTSYRWVKSSFKTYREKYNSGLFGEKEEQECDRIELSDETIEEVIRGMYKPSDRNIEYNFAAIDADVLGSIYEEYLSFVLKETPKRTKLEGGRAHRKEQGIYYTPTYIVDYIVKNTVSDYLKDKTIDQILDISILDPACGSGSFLIKAFAEVCKIVEDKLKKGAKSAKWNTFKSYSGRLVLMQKVTILTRCIHGVDLDQKAVEIAQLNILLKLLEGETSETLFGLRSTKKLLPMLDSNIKCGNSLIDDSAIAGYKAFDWEDEFPDIMKSGGFDVVIGNPPYGYRGIPTSEIKEAYSKKYKTSEGNFDMYRFFIERSINLMKEGALSGFIIPNTFLTATSYRKLRSFMLTDCQVRNIFDLGLEVFEGVTIESIIIILQKTQKKNNKIKISICRSRNVPLSSPESEYLITQKTFLDAKENTFNIYISQDVGRITNKIEEDSVYLEKIALVTVGINTGYIKNALVSPKKKDERYHKMISGRDISRYSLSWPGEWIIYDKKLVDSYGDRGRTLPDEIIFKNEKILVQRTRRGMKRKLVCTLDNEKHYNLNRLSNVVMKNHDYSLKYCLGVLNSLLMDYYFQKKFNEYEVKPAHLRQLPIKQLTLSKQQPIIKLVDRMLSLNKRLNEIGDKKTDERAGIDEEIMKTDKEIDELVYKIYGMTNEERRTIEEAAK